MAKVEKEMTMIRFTKRIPGAPYAYEEIEVTETVAPENLALRIAELRGLLDSELAGGQITTCGPEMFHALVEGEGVVEFSSDDIDDDGDEEKEVEAKPAPKKRGRKPKAAAPVVAPPEDEEDVDDETAVEPEPEEAPVVEEPKPKKKLKTANTPYDRESPFHRKLVSELLAASVPNWKAIASKVKEVSVEMNGAEMLTGEGDMLPEFKAKFIKLVKAK